MRQVSVALLHPAAGERFLQRSLYGYLAIGTIAAVIAAASHLHSDRAEALLQIEYRTKSSAEASDGARNVDQAFDLIYQNLRTLASLPGIRSIDRHGATLSPEAHTTFQMIYNNLASSVSVSEVYVVPANFNPQRVDPVTGVTEEPIIMFDEPILNAGSEIPAEQRALDPDSVREAKATGPAEADIHEFHQLAEHAAWFREHYSLSGNNSGLRVPIISGEEIITRDNTQFIHSGNDADRKGIIFSVPYFDAHGKFAGMVSAIILTDALRDLLPTPNYALVNPGNGFVSIKPDAGAHVVQARDAISRGKLAGQLRQINLRF